MSYRIGDLLFKACYDGKLDEVKRLLRELRTAGFTCPVHLPYDEALEDEEQTTTECGNDNTSVGYADLRRNRNSNNEVGQQDDTDALLASDWEESFEKTFGADKATEERKHEQKEERVKGPHHASEFRRRSSTPAIGDKNNNSTNTSTSTLHSPPPPQVRAGQPTASGSIGTSRCGASDRRVTSRYHQSINPSFLDPASCRCPLRRLYTAPTWRRESELLRYSLLHAAIAIGNVPIIEVLLKESRVGCFRRHCKGRRSVAAGGTRNRPLLGRSSSGACACSQCSKLLIDVNQANGRGESPALMAVKLPSPSPATIPILNLLADTGELDTGADSDTITGSSMLTALFEACRRDQLSVVETLISTCGVDYTRTSVVDGSSVLVNCRSVRMLQYFADLYETSRPSAAISSSSSAACSNPQTTPTHATIAQQRVENTTIAAASSANPSVATLRLAPVVLTRLLFEEEEEEDSPSQSTCTNDDEEITKTESTVTSTCGHANSRGKTNYHPEPLPLSLSMIGKREWIEGRMGRGKTVLHIAAESSDDLFPVEMCRVLVDRFGCDPHAVDVEGCTVLRRVADGSGSVAKARYFALECGVDPNKSDDGGWERKGGPEEGDDGDDDVHDADSLTPVDSSEKRTTGGKTRHAELMKRRAEAARCKTFGFGGERKGSGLTPLAAACYRGKAEMVAFFVSLGAYIIDDFREVLSALSSSSSSSDEDSDHQTQAPPSQLFHAHCPEKSDNNERSEETDGVHRAGVPPKGRGEIDAFSPLDEAGVRMLMSTSMMHGENNNNNSTNKNSRRHSTTSCRGDNEVQRKHQQGRPHYYNNFSFEDVGSSTAHTHRSRPPPQQPHAALLQRVHAIRRENCMTLRKIIITMIGGGGPTAARLSSVLLMLGDNRASTTAPKSIDGEASTRISLRPLVDVDGLSECNGVTAVMAAVASVVVVGRSRSTTASEGQIPSRAHGNANVGAVALDAPRRTPHMYTEQEQILSLLLSQGASTSAKCTAATFMIAREGETALHVAVRDGKYELVALLTDFGADPTAVDASGQIPATLLLSSSRRTISNSTRCAVSATHTEPPLNTSSSTSALGSSTCAMLRSGFHALPLSADLAASSPFATAHLTGRVGGFGRRSNETEGRTVPNVFGMQHGEEGLRHRGGPYEALASRARGRGGRGLASERGEGSGRGRARSCSDDGTEEEVEVHTVRPRGGGGGRGRGDGFGSFLDDGGRGQSRGRSSAQHRGAFVRGPPAFLDAQGASTAGITTGAHQPRPAQSQPPPPRLRDAQSKILSLFS